MDKGSTHMCEQNYTLTQCVSVPLSVPVSLYFCVRLLGGNICSSLKEDCSDEKDDSRGEVGDGCVCLCVCVCV